MLIKYPYILLGLTPIFFPIILIGGLFGVTAFIIVPTMETIMLDDEFKSSYDFMNESTQSTLFIYPQFTYYANEKNSLADIGNNDCRGCEKYAIFNENIWTPVIASGKGKSIAFKNFNIFLGGVSDVGGRTIYEVGFRYFNTTNDNSINVKPEILNDFDRIVLMRNVYITDEMRQAILAHNNVIYMFPDVMTKQVKLQNMTDAIMDENGNIKIANTTMTYVGDYPPLHPMAFEWVDDNRCEDWEFVPVQNGYMMNCVPDVAIINNYNMLVALRDISRP